MKYFIGLDIGTSSVKAMLISEHEILRTVSRDYPVFYPHDGWAEQDPSDWYEKTMEVLTELLTDIDRKAVEAISFSGQMHGLVMLDREDQVIRPAILWNDGRSTAETAYLNDEIGKPFLLAHTGNIAFPGFTAPKLLWVSRHEPDNFRKAEKIMLPKDYVAYRLSGVFATDVSDAAGTLYFDTEHRCWSKDMLNILHIDVSQLPEVHESAEAIGTLKPELADILGLSHSVQIVIGAGDNAASAIGTGAVRDGDCNISLGTSGTIFVACDSFSYDSQNAIHSFCSASGGYHYLACILSAASCQKWWIESIIGGDYAFNADKYLGKSRVLFLPYLMGERSPINDSSVRGMFCGLSLDTTKEEMALSVLEGVSFALRQNIEIIRKMGVSIQKSKVCGGGTRSILWLKILASVLKIDLEIPVLEHGGVLGAAVLAARPFLDDTSYRNMEEAFYAVKETISPDPVLSASYDEKYEKYLRLYPAIRDIQI